MINQGNWQKYEEILNNEKSDWKIREDLLKILIDGLQSKHNLTYEFISQQAKGLSYQLSDLRSAIGKLAS